MTSAPFAPSLGFSYHSAQQSSRFFQQNPPEFNQHLVTSIITHCILAQVGFFSRPFIPYIWIGELS